MGGLWAGHSLGMDLHQVSYICERQCEIISLLTHFPTQGLTGLLGFIKGLRSVKYIFLSSTPLSAAAFPSQEENCWLEVAGTEARPTTGSVLLDLVKLWIFFPLIAIRRKGR